MDGYYEMGKKKNEIELLTLNTRQIKTGAIYVRERHKTVADVPQMEPK